MNASSAGFIEMPAVRFADTVNARIAVVPRDFGAINKLINTKLTALAAQFFGPISRVFAFSHGN